MNTRTISVLLVAVVALGVTLGAATGAVAADDDLQVTIDDTDAEPVVTVTLNNSTVETASVTVEPTDDNATYAGSGNYTTDANGTVELPAADDDVTIEVTATDDNQTATITVDLEAPTGLGVAVEQEPGGEAIVTVTDGNSSVENASVNVTTVDENATYTDVGDYRTDENGTVTLRAPKTNVSVSVVATVDNTTASTTMKLIAEESEEATDIPFGIQIRDIIRNLGFDTRQGGIGDFVSEYVTTNNPGNAPDHAGNPHAEATTDSVNTSDQPGNAPAHAGQGATDHAGGPPEHAGGKHTDSDDGATGASASNAGNGNSGSTGSNGNGGSNSGNNHGGNGNGASNAGNSGTGNSGTTGPP